VPAHLNSQRDLDRAVRALVKRDERLQRVLEVTGMPTLRRRPPGFEGLARVIVGQQLSTASADAIWGRLSTAFQPFEPEAIRRATPARLGKLGLSRAKIKALKSIATEMRAKRLDLNALADIDADQAHATLTALHGVGPWTADVYLLFCLGHADAWPAADIGLQEGVRLGLHLAQRPTTKETEALADGWRPLRGAAAHLWWAYYRRMTRPHEDLERHTPTDHRPGGVPIAFERGAWCAIDIVDVKATRVDAGIGSYETLIEKARGSTAIPVRAAAVLRSDNKRRVIALLEISGHEAFAHMRSAWDDHHLVAERHDVAESTALALYRVIDSAGTATIDPAAHDIYAFERVALRPEQAPAFVASAQAAPGFRGILVFGSDDGAVAAVIYRFDHKDRLDAFRSGAAVVLVHPVRTFG
jgi:DNA-3-methyladenine glycosylase II